MSQRRSKSGCWGLRGCELETVSIADFPSRPIVMDPLVRLYLLQRAWSTNRLPEIPVSSLRYALCESAGPGTALIDMMRCDWLVPRKIEQEVP